ncbi:MAG TPA: hypothetical protein VHB21_10920 [Minicystis sp.]|nr:hypothetical protein [Minicystis sp.]
MTAQASFKSTGSAALDAFFAAALPYARGEISPDAFVDKVGPSASGTKRLALYPHIVLGDNRALLNKMFLGAQKATDRYRLGLWDRWLDEFQRQNPPTDWRVRLYGAPLFEFVKAKRAADPHQPLYLEELVDLAYTRASVLCHPVVEGDEVMDKTVFVRQYTHTTPQYLNAVVDDPDIALPEAKPTIVIVFRSLKTQRPRFLYPNLGVMLALARRTNTGAELIAQFKNVTEDMIALGEATLAEHGVLAPRPGQDASAPGPGA